MQIVTYPSHTPAPVLGPEPRAGVPTLPIIILMTLAICRHSCVCSCTPSWLRSPREIVISLYYHLLQGVAV